jgi:hypothetical protein
MVFPLLAISGSDPAEVEQVHLGIDSETDSLEQALVPDEVGAVPLRAQEDRGLRLQGLSLIGGKSYRNPVERSLECSQTSIQDDSHFNGREVLPQNIPYLMLEDAPRGGRVYHRQNGSRDGLQGEMNENARLGAGELEPALYIASATGGKGNKVPSEEKRSAGQDWGIRECGERACS